MMTGTAIFINDTSTTEIYTRSLHDALPIFFADRFGRPGKGDDKGKVEGLVGYARRNFLVPVPRVESFAALNAHLEARCRRSEEHTSELQSRQYLVCRLLLEKKTITILTPIS